MPKLSIIIPSYNVERYIERCINRLLDQMQQFPDVEIIAVNDCSTDSTKNKIIPFLNNVAVKMVDLEVNKGLPGARNAGVRVATGEYITFLDADDIVSADYLKEIFTTLEQNQHVEVIKFNFAKVYRGRAAIYNYYFYDNKEGLTGPEYYAKEMRLYGERIQNMAWLFVINRAFFEKNDLYFHEHPRIFEDMYFNANVMAHTKVLITIDKPLIYYIKYFNSIMHNNDLSKVKQNADVIYEISHILRNEAKRLESVSVPLECYSNYVLYMAYKRTQEIEYHDLAQKIEKEYQEYKQRFELCGFPRYGKTMKRFGRINHFKEHGSMWIQGARGYLSRVNRSSKEVLEMVKHDEAITPETV